MTVTHTDTLLINVCSLLEELIAEVKRGNSTAREGAASSIQIEDTPTKDLKVRVTSKIYAGSVLPVEEAIEAHGRAHRLAEQHALDGWAATIDSELRRAVGASPREAP